MIPRFFNSLKAIKTVSLERLLLFLIAFKEGNLSPFCKPPTIASSIEETICLYFGIADSFVDYNFHTTNIYK